MFIVGRGWIHARQQAAQCCHPYIISNNLLNQLLLPNLQILHNFLGLELIDSRVTWNKLHWRSYIHSRSWIHDRQPATQYCGHYILSINYLAHGIRISSSSQTCRSCLIFWFWYWLMPELHQRSCIGSRGLMLNLWQPARHMVLWPLHPQHQLPYKWNQNQFSVPPPKLADLVNFLGLELIDARVTSIKLHWRSCIQSRGWILGTQLATWCSSCYILSINHLANKYEYQPLLPNLQILLHFLWLNLIDSRVALEKLHSE